MPDDLRGSGMTGYKLDFYLMPPTYVRTLESALGKTAPAPSAPLQDPVQTPTSEGSELPTQDDAPGREGPHDRAGMRTSAPRRSTDSKKGVRPIQRTT